MKTLRHYTLLTSAIALLASMNSVASETTIAVTAENFSHAETARNYRNWAAQGANKGFVIMLSESRRTLPHPHNRLVIGSSPTGPTISYRCHRLITR